MKHITRELLCSTFVCCFYLGIDSRRICCWSCPPKWRSLLQWSHISHAMSHNFGSVPTSTYDLISLRGSGSRLVLVVSTNIVINNHQESNPILFGSGPPLLGQSFVFAMGLGPTTMPQGVLIWCHVVLVPCLALLATFVVCLSLSSTVVMHLLQGSA